MSAPYRTRACESGTHDLCPDPERCECTCHRPAPIGPTNDELAGRILAETPLESLPARLRPGTRPSTDGREEGAAPRTDPGADATTTGELTSHVASTR